jgi:hypothetical protein
LPRPNAMPDFEVARGRALEPRRSCEDVAGMLSRCEENVFEREEGRSEKRREDLPVSPLELFLREKPKDVRRLDSVLGRGPVVVGSFDIGPAIDVGG